MNALTRSLLSILFLVTFSCKPKFDKEIWLKNQNDNDDNPRFDMVNDLTENHLKRGVNRKEVVNLLGLPLYDTVDNRLEYSYAIGSNPGMHIDPFYLIVAFDSSGRMVHVRIGEH